MAQRVGVVVEHPLTQEYRRPPIESTMSEQSGVGSSQRVEQPPQRDGVVTSVSQPSCGLMEQCARLGRQASETSQAPATHRTAPTTMPVRVAQSLPQRPQLCTSREVSVQIDPHMVAPGHCPSEARSRGTSRPASGGASATSTVISCGTSMVASTGAPGTSTATSATMSGATSTDASRVLASGHMQAPKAPDDEHICAPLVPPTQAHGTTWPGVH